MTSSQLHRFFLKDIFLINDYSDLLALELPAGSSQFVSKSQSPRRRGQELTEFNLDRCPMLNPLLPCARICASTGTLAARYFCKISMVEPEQQGSLLAVNKNAGGASAGIVAGIKPGPG